jgi:hypothetical protein
LTPAVADRLEADAVAAIETIETPEAAEALLAQITLCDDAMRLAKLGEDRERRWKVLRLKAERRYGELLGPAETGRPEGNVTGGHVSSDVERKARKQARKVAAVPQGAFDDYVASEPKPSREGLLRKTPSSRSSRPRRERSDNVLDDDRVIAWIARRLRAGKTREEIADEAKAGLYDWPLPGRSLGVIAVREAMRVLRDRRRRGDTLRARRPKESGKRLRQLHAEKRGGRTGDLWRLQKAISEAVSMLEGFDLPALDWSEETEDVVAELYDDLERNLRWLNAALEAVTAHMDELGRQRKLTQLRARADDPSSTAAERATAAMLAEKLARKRRAMTV